MERLRMPLSSIYLAFTFAFAWLCWGLSGLIISRHLPLPLIGITMLGAFAPFFAAGICAWASGGVRGMRRFYARALAWRMGWPVFLIALLLAPALCVLSARIYAWQAHQAFTFQLSWRDVPESYLFLLVLGGAMGEEFGWSYLSDRLDEKFPEILANMLLGVIWGFWHLPLFFLAIPGALQHLMPFALFLLASVVWRFLFSWSYHKGGRSILANLLMHNGINFGLSLVVIVPQTPEPVHLRLWYLILFCAIAALGLYGLAPPAKQLPCAQGACA